MDHVPSLTQKKIPETGVRKNSSMSVIVEIAARLQAEIGLHDDQPSSGAQNSAGLTKNIRAVFDAEMLEEVGCENSAKAPGGERPRIERRLDERRDVIPPVLHQRGIQIERPFARRADLS